MPAEKVRQVYLAASAFAEHCAFVEHVLGFQLQFRDGDNWAQYEGGGVSLAIASAAESAGVAAGNWIPVLEVADLEEMCRSDVAAGGECASVRDMGDHGRTCLVHDAAGAAYSLICR